MLGWRGVGHRCIALVWLRQRNQNYLFVSTIAHEKDRLLAAKALPCHRLRTEKPAQYSCIVVVGGMGIKCPCEV